MSVVYNGAHSITFIEALDSDTDSTPTAYSSYKRSWRDFHLVPEKRPSVNPPSPALKLIDIPGTNRRIDMTDLMPGGLKFGRRQGEWQFILDHDLWDNWHTAKKTIEDAINGKRLYCILEDDFNTAYRGRFRVQGWQSGPNYSSIVISYDLEYKKYTNAFNVLDDVTENKMLSSWASVDGMIKDGSYKKNIAIHDTCHLYIPGEYNDEVEVAGIDLDTGGDGYYNYKKLPITWIAKKLLNTKQKINESNTFYVDNVVNYKDSSFYRSDLYQKLTFTANTDSILKTFPSRLTKMIKRCYKREQAYYFNDRTNTNSVYAVIETSYPALWVPSHREITGLSTYETEADCPVYNQIFNSATSRYRISQNYTGDWKSEMYWLRTARNYYCMSVIDHGGAPGYRSVTDALGILLCFCTGSSIVDEA